jgi:hypothetical protein
MGGKDKCTFANRLAIDTTGPVSDGYLAVA